MNVTTERPRELNISRPVQANTSTSGQLPYTVGEPFTIIEPKKSWGALNLRDIWNYRELLYFLTWRDIKLRYKQTLLGVAWVVIQPLATMVIFSIFFGRLAGLQQHTGNVPYPLFAFAGLTLWMFFSAAVNSSGNSLVNSAHLLTKVYFPRLILPIAAVGGTLVDFAICLLLLVAIMVYYGVAPSISLLAVPLIVCLTTLLAVSVGTLLSAINVKYRDVRHALPFVIQLWMFASPIVYPTALVPGRWRWLLALNPLVGIIEAFRTSLFGGRQFDWPMLAVAGAITLLLAIIAGYNFKRMEKEFADIV